VLFAKNETIGAGQDFYMTMHFGSRSAGSQCIVMFLARLTSLPRPTIGNFTHERGGTALLMVVMARGGSGTTAMTVVRSV